jgi:hypothetical protein
MLAGAVAAARAGSAANIRNFVVTTLWEERAVKIR